MQWRTGAVLLRRTSGFRAVARFGRRTLGMVGGTVLWSGVWVRFGRRFDVVGRADNIASLLG